LDVGVGFGECGGGWSCGVVVGVILGEFIEVVGELALIYTPGY
jgi:hypothetical protein